MQLNFPFHYCFFYLNATCFSPFLGEFLLIKIKVILFWVCKVHAAHASFQCSVLATLDASATYSLWMHRCLSSWVKSEPGTYYYWTWLPLLLMLRLIYFWIAQVMIDIEIIQSMSQGCCYTKIYSSLKRPVSFHNYCCYFAPTTRVYIAC